MSLCSRCESAEPPFVHAPGPARFEYRCRNCAHTWATVEVPEEYLRDLVSRSLELAALKSKFNLKEPS